MLKKILGIADETNIEYEKLNDNERNEDGENFNDVNESNEDPTFIENEHTNLLFDSKTTTTFRLNIPYNKYLQIKPSLVNYKNKGKKRSYAVLKPNSWTDVINDAFLAKYKLSCNFIFKRNKVAVNTFDSQFFLTFNAKCKDKGCPLFGWSKNKPEKGHPLKINIQAMDTRGQELEHTSKRPLKGEKRIIIGKDLSYDLSCNWRRNNVSNMEFGQFSPPNLYNIEVLRKTKQEYKDKLLNITEKCHIISLVELKHNSQFAGSIHYICVVPFIVHYWSTHQLIIYKDLNKSYLKVSIDATGGLVKKIKRSSLNLLSSHIFLYEVVVNTGYG